MSQPLEAAIYFVWVCRPDSCLPPPERTCGSTPHTHHAVLLPPPGATLEKLAEPSWPLRHPVTLTILGHPLLSVTTLLYSPLFTEYIMSHNMFSGSRVPGYLLHLQGGQALGLMLILQTIYVASSIKARLFSSLVSDSFLCLPEIYRATF